jgi:hypothetical protein
MDYAYDAHSEEEISAIEFHFLAGDGGAQRNRQLRCPECGAAAFYRSPSSGSVARVGHFFSRHDEHCNLSRRKTKSESNNLRVGRYKSAECLKLQIHFGHTSTNKYEDGRGKHVTSRSIVTIKAGAETETTDGVALKSITLGSVHSLLLSGRASELASVSVKFERNGIMQLSDLCLAPHEIGPIHVGKKHAVHGSIEAVRADHRSARYCIDVDLDFTMIVDEDSLDRLLFRRGCHFSGQLIGDRILMLSWIHRMHRGGYYSWVMYPEYVSIRPGE